MSEMDEKRIMQMIGGEAPKPQSKTSDKATGKKQPQSRKKVKQEALDFQDTFFQRVEITDRQPLYLSRNTYEQIRIIVNGIGGNKASMSAYVERIIEQHFEQYRDEIIRLFNENIKKPFE